MEIFGGGDDDFSSREWISVNGLQIQLLFAARASQTHRVGEEERDQNTATMKPFVRLKALSSKTPSKRARTCVAKVGPPPHS